MRFVLASVVVVTGCISSPSVSLVDQPDAATLVADTSDAGSAGEADGSSSTPPEKPAPDAGPGPTPSLCDGRCKNAGGSCNGDVCTFSCPGSAACNDDIICPSGMPCTVTCTGKEACPHEVRCLQATDCNITCDGENACKNKVSCAGPTCAISCVNKGCSADEVRCCAKSCTFNGTPLTCP